MERPVWINTMPYNINTNYKDCSGYAVVGPEREREKKIWKNSAFE